MSPFGRWATCAALLVGGLVPVAGPVVPVCAAGTPRAALVVDTGEGVHNFCVALPDDEVTGLELIALAGEQHGLSYRFGHGGGAVCMLAGVGATSDDCFEHYPDFWGYWRGSSNGWSWSSTGAGNTSVGDGDVEGWSWGSGNDGNSHPRPPDTSFSSVCPAAAPSEARRPPAQKEPKERSNEQPRAGSPAPVPDPAGPAPRAANPDPAAVEEATKRPRKKREERARKLRRPGRTADVRPEPSAGDDDLLATRRLRAEDEEGSAPPPAGVAALGAAALLGGAGFVFSRRRRRRS